MIENDNDMYMISRSNEPFVITQYVVDGTKEMMIKAEQILGPLDNLERNRTDYVFTLGDIDGLFVAAQRDGIVLSKSQLKQLGL